MSNSVLEEQVSAVVLAAKAIGDCVHSLGAVPETELYVRLMANGCTLEAFNYLVDLLIDGDVIKRNGIFLVAVKN